jgi:protein TonB
VVVAELTIDGGRVVNTRIVSGPRVFHAAVMAATRAYSCKQLDHSVLVTQEFNFTLDE